EPFLQALAVDEFHGHVVPALNLVHTVGLNDIRRIEQAHDLSFTAQALDQLFVVGDVREKNLEGHLAMDADLLGLPDFAHGIFARRAAPNGTRARLGSKWAAFHENLMFVGEPNCVHSDCVHSDCVDSVFWRPFSGLRPCSSRNSLRDYSIRFENADKIWASCPPNYVLTENLIH